MTTTERTPDLPHAVPPLDPDFDHACRELGRALMYVAQLSAVLNKRAAEANNLDDQLQAARLRIQELEGDNQSLRGQLGVAEAVPFDVHATEGGV